MAYFHIFLENLSKIIIFKEDVKTLMNYIDALSLESEIIFFLLIFPNVI